MPPVTSNQFETLQEELYVNEVKSLLKGQENAVADRLVCEEVNALNQPKANPPGSRRCFECASPSHLLRDCSSAPLLEVVVVHHFVAQIGDDGDQNRAHDDVLQLQGIGTSCS